ncbi:hypothetical protein EGW08_019351 [Elysia chlorotica]|uniref:Uncharacterized protein n=1 Tax=Elysia chlorotica TaxID=188477 RepID=A0A3S1BR43_ELYCH|nr:hypothetical protein EGW08_019351 [Elysia chlorotica]
MSNSTNKKVTFKEEIDDQSNGEAECLFNIEEEPYITLKDPLHSCPFGVPPNTKLVNSCLNKHSEDQSKDSPSNCTRGLPDRSLEGQSPLKNAHSGLDSKGVTSGATLCPSNVDPARKSKSPVRTIYDGTSAGQRLTDKIKEMVIEEEFRRDNPKMRRQFPKYRGICGSLGNPVFTSTPVGPPEYQAKCPARRVPGYPPPKRQNPLYYTTSNDYGSSEPCFETTPIVFYPNDQSFTLSRALGGMYEDAHLTTDTDSTTLW